MNQKNALYIVIAQVIFFSYIGIVQINLKIKIWNIYIIILLLISNQTFAQLQETKETVLIDGKEYCFTLLSYGQYSKTKSMKVLTCDKKHCQKIKLNIKECYKKYKIDYTDFYIIPIDKNNSDNSEIIILEKCLQRIDEIRMSQNLSTIQIQFK